MAVILSKQIVMPVMGKPASDFAIGDSVFLNVNGVPTEFLVVHQGNPDAALYDASCEGTWLLMKDIYERGIWDENNENDYENSDIHPYLNGTFLDLFDADIKTQIKQVTLPYHKGLGNSGSVASGVNGLSTKVFLLSGSELGWSTNGAYRFPVDGAKLSYFESGTGTSANNKRIAYQSGSAFRWWTRSPHISYNYNVWQCEDDGTYDYYEAQSAACGYRPALILPYDALFNPDTNELVGVG